MILLRTNIPSISSSSPVASSSFQQGEVGWGVGGGVGGGGKKYSCSTLKSLPDISTLVFTFDILVSKIVSL